MRFEEIPQNVIEKARSGDHLALEELCLMVQPGAYAVLLSLLRNADDAADALQESLIRVVRFLPSVRDTATFPGWLMRLLINQANSTRHRAPTAVIDVASLDNNDGSARIAATSSAPASPRRAAAQTELGDILNKSIANLPPRQRTALVFFEMEQLSIRKIAELMELTDGAVKFHLHEARKNLRARLTENGIGADMLITEESTG